MVSRAVESPPIIDAHLDDSAWQTSDVAGEFVNLQNENPQAMTVWVVCHDTRSLYLGVLCRDGELVTEMRERDQTASEDWMEVQVVADGRLGNDYRFRVNAAGSRMDARQKDEFWNASPDWEAATRETETGWTVEMAIPFLAVGAFGGIIPGAWFVRVLRSDTSRDEATEMSSWTPFGRRGQLDTSVYGLLHFGSRNPKMARRSVRMLETDRPHFFRPGNGATVDPVSLTMAWPNEPAASVYELQLSDSPRFSEGLTVSYTIDTPTCAPTPLPAGRQWYWRYRMRAYGGWVSGYSKIRTFLTSKSGGQPIQVAQPGDTAPTH
ncbi:MAG: hypothetical protein AUJ92_03370 [Armatimonadetes bacterium CG2_30_59_28]|nr:MAG: hypothetical protein AUJ92_03370 [Armatimonadetes bacterium CG2_30_59_28]PIU65148.1 MAG: hypothetical protein COS85_09955 [Armatimonadetes bacterium CG07_land_8_20_14_0_80_59_28]